jgi:hypothetical protein
MATKRGTRVAGGRESARGGRAPSQDDDEPISPALLRELKRRIKEAADPTRYSVVSVLGPRFLLYYDVRDGSYPMNDLARATLFKELEVARAVLSVLGDGHAIMKVRIAKDGSIKRVTPLRELVKEAERDRRLACKRQRAP